MFLLRQYYYCTAGLQWVASCDGPPPVLTDLLYICYVHGYYKLSTLDKQELSYR